MDKHKLLLVLSLLLILISVVAHAGRIRTALPSVADDMNFDLLAPGVTAGGFSAYWHLASSTAVDQARFYFYASIITFLLPYFFPEGLLRVVIIVAVQFASLLALVLYLRKYLSSRTAWYLMAFLCALLPLWNRFYPITSLPIFYHVPILLFFGALVLHDRTRQSRPAIRYAWLLPLFGSLLFYEALLLPFLVIAILETLPAAVPAPASARRVRQIRAVAPVLLVFAFFGVLLLGYRQVHPTRYAGSRVASFSLPATLRGIAAFSGEALPATNLILQTGLIPEIADGYRPPLRLPAILLAHLSVFGWLQALLALAIAVLYVWTAGPPKIPRPVWLALLSVALALAVPLPLTVAEKYRDAAANWAPYMPGYYAYLAWMAAFALLLEPATARLAKRGATRLGAAATLGIVCFALVAATSVANDAVSVAHDRDTIKWRVVDAVLKTSALDRLPPGATLFAPSLWDDFPQVTWMPYEDYWSQYLALHSGRRLPVARTLDPASLRKDPPAPTWYGEVLPGTCAGPAFLLTRIARDAAGSARLSDQAILVSQAPPDACDLQAIVARKPADLLTQDDPHTYIRLPHAQIQNGVYVAAFETPGVLAGSATLVPRTALHWQGVPGVELDFVNGFSTKEEVTGNYWIWSNGASGEAGINLRNNTGHPLSARFHCILMTGQPTPTRFDIDAAPALHQSQMLANGDAAEWVLELQPGDNPVHLKSYGPRVPSPGDPRYLVFGLKNWSLRAEGAP